MVLILKPLGGKTVLMPMSCAISATNARGGVALMTDPPHDDGFPYIFSGPYIDGLASAVRKTSYEDVSCVMSFPAMSYPAIN